jgi:hypothetical protein
MRFGITSFAAGLALYVVAAIARLGAYRGEAQPSWLTTLWLVATLLLVVGLLVMVNVAVRAYRERVP